MNNSLVSIIIPTYNRGHLIGETLNSVLAQTYTNWECIIVDDGSTDNTDFVVRQYMKNDHRFNYLTRPEYKSKGACVCRNFGLENAKGDFVVFLDSDDVLLQMCLENRIFKIQENPEKDFWVFPMFIQNENKNKEIVEIPVRDNYLNEFLSCKIHWGIMCTIWDVRFIKKLNGFNELYPRLNDPEVHIRAMILSKTRYLIFADADPDSIYMAASVKDKNNFAKNYSNSLNLFIPDIVKKLNENGQHNELKRLRNYLSHYFLNFYNYNSKKNNIKVLITFRKNKVITYSMYFKMVIQYYLFLFFNKGSKITRQRIVKLMKF